MTNFRIENTNKSNQDVKQGCIHRSCNPVVIKQKTTKVQILIWGNCEIILILDEDINFLKKGEIILISDEDIKLRKSGRVAACSG